MVFSVKYRDSSGAVCEKAVEAANRADCFAKCKVQGIVPIGVDVSAATKKPAHASGFEASAKSKIVMLVVALMAVGAAVWLWPKGKPTSDTVPEKKKTIAKEKDATKEKAVTETNAIPKTAKPKEITKPKDG